jgi:hypothetical protein
LKDRLELRLTLKPALLILTIFILLSGCVEKNDVNQSNAPVNQSQTNLSPAIPPQKNIPEIKITSFSSIYTHDSHGYNIKENYYAIYNLSIKNNGLSNLYFKLNELYVRNGDQIFNITVEPEGLDYSLDVFSDHQNTDKIEDMTLFPGQTINGSVFFQVNSLYDESFSLMYKETPISSTSFEKSIKALKTAENFDYSTAFGIPPYTTVFESQSSFEPDLANYPYIGPNWINRSIFEFFNKTDSEEMIKSPPDKIARTEIVYALEAIPERNITVIPVQTRSWKNFFLAIEGIDNTGEEVVNIPRINAPGVVIRKQSSNPWWGIDVPQTNSSNATVVKILFWGNYYIEPANARFSRVNQEVIVGNELNIVAARCHPFNFHGV